MNIFDQLKDIIEIKSNKLLDDFDTYQDFSPYLLCRWISMIRPDNAFLMNETLNMLYSGIGDKQQWYKLFMTLTPKERFRYVKYIKKNKEHKKSEITQDVKKIAEMYELSTREIEDFIQKGFITEKEIKELKI